MSKIALGEEELAMLRYISEQGALTAAEVAEGVAQGRLALTTVHTMLERVRKKGYLVREKSDGRYRYTSLLPQSELLTGLVGLFVRRSLQGSLIPLIRYLATAGVNEDELRELVAMARLLESRRRVEEVPPAPRRPRRNRSNN